MYYIWKFHSLLYKHTIFFKAKKNLALNEFRIYVAEESTYILINMLNFTTTTHICFEKFIWGCYVTLNDTTNFKCIMSTTQIFWMINKYRVVLYILLRLWYCFPNLKCVEHRSRQITHIFLRYHGRLWGHCCPFIQKCSLTSNMILLRFRILISVANELKVFSWRLLVSDKSTNKTFARFLLNFTSFIDIISEHEVAIKCENFHTTVYTFFTQIAYHIDMWWAHKQHQHKFIEWL